MAQKFAEITYERCGDIYKECYDTFFEQVSLCPDDLSLLAKERKNLFEEIFKKLQKRLVNCDFHYVTRDSSRELPVERNDAWEWNMPWMSCGFILKKDYYVALTCLLAYNGSNPHLFCEIGIRRCPKQYTIEKQFYGQLTDVLTSKGHNIYIENKWWYVARDIKESLNTDDLVNELIELASILEENDSNK